MSGPDTSAYVQVCECLTPFGGTHESWSALCRGDVALRAQPALGDSGDLVPLALFEEMHAASPPRWFGRLVEFLEPLRGRWGGSRRPVFVSSSNFGIDSLYFQRLEKTAGVEAYASAERSIRQLQQELGWGANICLFSHACVSANVALLAATAALRSGIDEALVLSFDFLSPFVVGGFHSLKILNAQFPQPYHAGETGSIGLGEGAAYAVLSRNKGTFQIGGQCTWNEMYHFTGNNPDRSGFDSIAHAVRESLGGRKAWIKGHGTGTIDAGRLEAEAFCAALPGAPLVGWKGSIGHTLGSCGLVEMAIASRSMEQGTAPGTVGSSAPYFTNTVTGDPIDVSGFDAAILTSNAFGGAHAGLVLSHA